MLQRLRKTLRPPYSLRTTLMAGLSLLAVLMLVLNGVLSYVRISSDTQATARHQAQSIATLVASAGTEPLIVSDIGAIESLLRQVVELPAVDGIAVVRADKRLLAEVRQEQGRIVLRMGGTVALPELREGSPASPLTKLTEQHNVSWAPIMVTAVQPVGWVRVDYSLQQRDLELERLWRRSLLTLTVTIALILTVLPLILNRALRPIRELSVVAGDLSTRLGQGIAIDSSNLEANVLAEALNKASHDVAQEVARTQVIVNTAAMAIIGLDEHGTVVSANPATTSIFGREESELLGLPLQQCVPGLDGPMLQSLFGEQDQDASRVYRIVRHDFFGTRQEGTLFPAEITLGQAPMGDVLRYVCIVRDVTDERAVQETTELYERALASSHNGVFIASAAVDSQPVIFVNDAFQKIFGLPLHHILGRGITQLLPYNPDDPDSVELHGALAEQRSTQTTLRYIRDSGSQMTAEISVSPVRSSQGNLTHFVGIVSDVTARVQAEEAIAERGAQLDAIFSLSPDGFVLFDEDGYLMFANPAFERMTGQTWKQAGLPITLQEFEYGLAALCHPEHRPTPLQTETGDASSWQARLVLSRPQHRVIQAQLRRNLAGRRETILYFRDVTHEDEVDRMKSEFLASAAHELRTPMVSIFGFTELLLKRQFSDERRADMLQTIHRQSGLLVKMINELLDLARIESRRGLDLHIGLHPLSELVSNSVKGLMRKDNERQVGLSRIPDVPVLIDPEKMQLALNNLLGNAFKYSPQGGEVTLTARSMALEGRDYAVIEVRDEGIGMTPEQLARAFERFYRADASGNIPGTGLGLSLVKEIAELHNGRVELESAPGCGTMARLWIPMLDISADDAARKPPG